MSESTNQMKYLIFGKPRFGITYVIVTLYQTRARWSFMEITECLVERYYLGKDGVCRTVGSMGETRLHFIKAQPLKS